MSIENNMNENKAHTPQRESMPRDSRFKPRRYNNHDRKSADNNAKKQNPKQKNFKYKQQQKPQQKTGSKPAVKNVQKQQLRTGSRKGRRGTSKLKVIPLGGLEQIGMNITAFEYEDSIVVVDCGLSFPEDDMLGIDLVIPDVTYLKENISKVKGFVITHGHEDHIGALPYILKEVNVPIYSTKLTLGLITNKLKEHNLVRSTKLKEVKHGQVINLGDFSIEFIKTNHSIQDASALAIYSPAGIVVHTGDFKVDYTVPMQNVRDSPCPNVPWDVSLTIYLTNTKTHESLLRLLLQTLTVCSRSLILHTVSDVRLQSKAVVWSISFLLPGRVYGSTFQNGSRYPQENYN